MNIFILDNDPEIAARSQCDKHVVKMILESAQLMATAIAHYGGTPPYKPTHVNHPCNVWARATRGNYLWLLAHHEAMLDEYTLRYEKTHRTAQYLIEWQQGVFLIPEGSLTPFAQAMPEELRIPDNPVEAYRSYYLRDKAGFATWRLGKVPDWWQYQPALAK